MDNIVKRILDQDLNEITYFLCRQNILDTICCQVSEILGHFYTTQLVDRLVRPRVPTYVKPLHRLYMTKNYRS